MPATTAEPLVSIIIPTYNRASLITAAVETALRQTWKAAEVIVVDDGSTDDTRQRLGCFGSRIRLISRANGGAAAARNAGAAVAAGAYLAFLDSDDTWEPRYLNEMIQLILAGGDACPCCLANAVAIVGGAVTESTSFGAAALRAPAPRGLWKNPLQVLLTRFVLFVQCALIRREAFIDTHGFDESLQVMEDYDLAIRLAMKGPWVFTTEPLVHYRIGSPGSLSEQHSRGQSMMKENSIRTLGKVFAESSGLSVLQRAGLALTLAYGRIWLFLSRRVRTDILKSGILLMLDRCERTFKAVQRRTPWYPRMRVETFVRRS